MDNVLEARTKEEVIKETRAMLTTRSTGEPCYFIRGKFCAYEVCPDSLHVFAFPTGHFVSIIMEDMTPFLKEIPQDVKDRWLVSVLLGLSNDIELAEKVTTLKYLHENIRRTISGRETMSEPGQ